MLFNENRGDSNFNSDKFKNASGFGSADINGEPDEEPSKGE